MCCLFLVLKAASEESDVILQTYQTAMLVVILAFLPFSHCINNSEYSDEYLSKMPHSAKSLLQ